jgi:pimeloyl-ACP methyl ester carboxylesterase
MGIAGRGSRQWYGPDRRSASAADRRGRHPSSDLHGLSLTSASTLIRRFSPSGRYLGRVTADSVIGIHVLLGAERLPNSAVRHPLLAICATIRGVEDMFPDAGCMDSTNQARAAPMTTTVRRELDAARARIRRSLTGARVVEIPGGSHAIFRSHTAQVKQEMRAFLREAERSPLAPSAPL